MKVTKTVRASKKSKRLFHKRVIRVIVLSEEPLPEGLDLDTINEMITTGECSGEVNWGNDLVLDSKRIVKALHGQGSDASFFQLNDDGSEIDEGSGTTV